jgi:hypothetical protein
MTMEYTLARPMVDEPTVMLVNDEYYVVRRGTSTMGYVYRAGNVFVALEGKHFPHACEVGQSLSLDAAIGRGLDGAVQGMLEIGPVSRALDGQPDHLRTAAANEIREALTPFAKGDAVLLPASVWVVTAKAS